MKKKFKLTYLSILNRGMRDDSNNMNNNNYDDVIDFNEQMEKNCLTKSFSHLKSEKCIYNNFNQLV